jgi:hypothetical protein
VSYHLPILLSASQLINLQPMQLWDGTTRIQGKDYFHQ